MLSKIKTKRIAQTQHGFPSNNIPAFTQVHGETINTRRKILYQRVFYSIKYLYVDISSSTNPTTFTGINALAILSSKLALRRTNNGFNTQMLESYSARSGTYQLRVGFSIVDANTGDINIEPRMLPTTYQQSLYRIVGIIEFLAV